MINIKLDEDIYKTVKKANQKPLFNKVSQDSIKAAVAYQVVKMMLFFLEGNEVVYSVVRPLFSSLLMIITLEMLRWRGKLRDRHLEAVSELADIVDSLRMEDSNIYYSCLEKLKLLERKKDLKIFILENYVGEAFELVQNKDEFGKYLLSIKKR